jgi:hypothetical protein
MTKPIPPLDLSWLLIESSAGTTHVGAMLLFKKPAGRAPIVREIVEACRACHLKRLYAAAIDEPRRLAHHALQAYAELKEAAGMQPARPKRASSHHVKVS